MALVKNQEYTAKITGYTAQGAGVARIEGQVVFIPLALKGETVRVKIIKVSKSLCYGRVCEIIAPSPARMTPECPAFPKCGGCDLWHMSRAEELELKAQTVRDALERIGGFASPNMGEIIAQPGRDRYRNKCMFPVGQRDGRIVSGFFRSHSHDIVECGDCRIQTQRANRLKAQVCEWAQECGIPAYDEETGSGVLRNIFVRSSDAGDALCLVVTKKPGHLEELMARLRGSAVSLSININTTRGNTLLGREIIPVCGDGYWTDTLCGLSFRISPLAFYQVNRDAAERLYAKALEYARLSADSLALDLYCGTGTISLLLASRAGRVIGVELVPDAIEDAKENARRNRVDNVEFMCMDAGKAAGELAERGTRPEVIVVDPPRKGLDADAIHAILKMSPERLVYVSCDPATLARDARLLCQGGYTLVQATPVDMFPATRHVETVALLEKSRADG